MRQDLIEAYAGRREDLPEYRRGYERYTEALDGLAACLSYEAWLEEEVVHVIEIHTPLQRLEEYLEWNGIVGWTSAIFEIAHGGGVS